MVATASSEPDWGRDAAMHVSWLLGTACVSWACERALGRPMLHAARLLLGAGFPLLRRGSRAAGRGRRIMHALLAMSAFSPRGLSTPCGVARCCFGLA